MTARKKSQLPPSFWPLNPGYEIDLDPLPGRLRVELGGEVVAETQIAKVMYELGHAPTFCLPVDDVHPESLLPSDHHTHCPYKGDAGYFHVAAGGATVENAVWYYDDPYDEMTHLKGLLGFCFERFDAWFRDGTRIDAPPEIEGRINDKNNFARMHPKLAADWHPQKNPRTRSYEFSDRGRRIMWWKM